MDRDVNGTPSFPAEARAAAASAHAELIRSAVSPWLRSVTPVDPAQLRALPAYRFKETDVGLALAMLEALDAGIEPAALADRVHGIAAALNSSPVQLFDLVCSAREDFASRMVRGLTGWRTTEPRTTMLRSLLLSAGVSTLDDDEVAAAVSRHPAALDEHAACHLIRLDRVSALALCEYGGPMLFWNAQPAMLAIMSPAIAAWSTPASDASASWATARGYPLSATLREILEFAERQPTQIRAGIYGVARDLLQGRRMTAELASVFLAHEGRYPRLRWPAGIQQALVRYKSAAAASNLIEDGTSSEEMP